MRTDCAMEIDLTQKTDLVLRRRREAPKKGCQFILGDIFVVGNWTVPVGFQTDLVSVPAIARMFVSKLDGVEASCLHDWHYSTKTVRRKTADRIFLEMLKGVVPEYKRWAMYAALRAGGWYAWNAKE